MSYVDAFIDRKADKILIAERVNGVRNYLTKPINYVFYYEDSSGQYRSIFDHVCKRSSTTSGAKFRASLAEHRRHYRIFESDINPIFRYLADQYIGAEVPTLNIGFFDIEADFDSERGYAQPVDPFNAVTAISLYRSADKKLLTWVLCPPTVAPDGAAAIVGQFADTYLFTDEAALLSAFLDAIEDVDVLTGWNSAGYDVPYLVNRISRVISKTATKKFCLWDQMPTERKYVDKFGKPVVTYDFVGRVHLDYIELYRKHNTQQRLSYALNAIGEIEVEEIKTRYDGTLDDLYKKDLFKFIEYNRQDVMLMVKIDHKLKFIDLANQIAHANCVLLKTTMGSVALIEQSIINEMHALDRIVPDRKPRDESADWERNSDPEIDDDEDDDHSPVVGAYVAQPKKGLHKHVGAIDLKSLYPSTLRALNMSPETLIGQVRPIETMRMIDDRIAHLPATKRAEAWEGVFCTLEVQHMHDQDDVEMTVDFFDNLTDAVITRTMTGKQLHDFVNDADNCVCVSANGTLFRTDVEGIIPALLTKWYAEREYMQAEAKKYYALASGIEIDQDLADLLAGPTYLHLDGSKIVPTPEYFLQQSAFWDRRQLATKIKLNSLYGALLQENCRFYDQRLGQSTTLSGRSIVKHMNATINQIITGVYDYKGEAIHYSDTDSAYFSAYHIFKDQPLYKNFEWSCERVIELYDLIAEATNEAFPAFMQTTFHTSLEKGAIIKGGRELVASMALFIKKKKYAALIYDLDGKRQDIDGKPGKLKVMGLDLKRSDTPRVMQQFLEKILMGLLTGRSQADLFADIREFRAIFKTRPGWEKGSPMKVANLSVHAKRNHLNSLTEMRNEPAKKVATPWHVQASLNWNLLCEMNKDRHALRITDSARIVVCKLLNNSYGMTAIGYPIDETHLPQWFRDLPFDHAEMENKIIDKKLDNLVGVLTWDLTDTREKSGNEYFKF
jgi:DNA polymerase elongation subunit (family B)